MAEKEPFWSKQGEGRVCALSLVCKTRSSIFLKVQQALRVLLARSGRGARDTRDGCSHRACLALRASLALTPLSSAEAPAGYPHQNINNRQK